MANLPVSGRPCPEVTWKPKEPCGGRCICSRLVPSGNTSTTRPTVRGRSGAPMSSVLSECRRPEAAFLQGDAVSTEQHRQTRAKKGHIPSSPVPMAGLWQQVGAGSGRPAQQAVHGGGLLGLAERGHLQERGTE